MSHSSNPPSMRQSIEELKQYFSLQYEWIKLDGIEKLTRIVSALIILTLSIILISIVLLYLSLSAVHYIESYTGIVAAYSIVAGVFFLLFIILWLLRRVCIVNPVLRFLYHLFITPKEESEAVSTHKNNEL